MNTKINPDRGDRGERLPFLITHPCYTFPMVWKDHKQLSCLFVAYNIESLDDKIARSVQTEGKNWDLIARNLNLKDIKNAQGATLTPGEVFYRWNRLHHRTIDIQMHPAVRVPSVFWMPGANLQAASDYYPEWLLLISVGLSIILAGIYVKYPGQLLFLVPASLLFGAAVNGIVVYHADAAEVERHALINALAIHVGLILSIFLLLDTSDLRRRVNSLRSRFPAGRAGGGV